MSVLMRDGIRNPRTVTAMNNNVDQQMLGYRTSADEWVHLDRNHAVRGLPPFIQSNPDFVNEFVITTPVGGGDLPHLCTYWCAKAGTTTHLHGHLEVAVDRWVDDYLVQADDWLDQFPLRPFAHLDQMARIADAYSLPYDAPEPPAAHLVQQEAVRRLKEAITTAAPGASLLDPDLWIYLACSHMQVNPQPTDPNDPNSESGTGVLHLVKRVIGEDVPWR